MDECWQQWFRYVRVLEEGKNVRRELHKESQEKCAVCCLRCGSCVLTNPAPSSSSQSQSSYIIRNPQQRRISQSQPVRGRDEEQDDIVSADVEEVFLIVLSAGDTL